MRTVEALIAETLDLCQGESELARRLGWSRSQVSDLKSGRTPPSPETVALLCDLLELPGEECQRLAAQAIIDNPKNARKAVTLRRAFFGCLATGVAICGLIVTGPNAALARTAATIEATVYTLCAVSRAIVGALWHGPSPTLRVRSVWGSAPATKLGLSAFCPG